MTLKFENVNFYLVNPVRKSVSYQGKRVESSQSIIIKGAREHNLKDVTVEIPKNSLVVITGPSGSGKSSLALDVLYTEGKRRYMDSLSSYARQFLGVVGKPEVDAIDGLCPAIAIEQKTVGSNPRSTVGTITEIYDCLRVLFAQVGVPHCPKCHKVVKAESPESLSTLIQKQFHGQVITIHAPFVHDRKGEYTEDLKKFFQSGYYRFRIDGVVYKFTHIDEISKLKLQKMHKHTIDILVDSIDLSEYEHGRVQASVEHAFHIGKGVCKISSASQLEQVYSIDHVCLHCGESMPEFEPRNFSFNSPIGACQQCEGLGIVSGWMNGLMEAESRWSNLRWKEEICDACDGKRLNPYALAVKINDCSIADLAGYSIADLRVFFDNLVLDPVAQEVVKGLIKELKTKIEFLQNVGLPYLTLSRAAQTLSGGEAQRIRLATQIGSMLTGVLYVLDEPSIGLHQRDNDKLIKMLELLRDIGNTVVVVEHDLDTIARADFIIEMGPGAGVHGGMVVATGTPEEIKNNEKSLTGGYLSGRLKIIKTGPLRPAAKFLTLKHLSKNNLKNITVSFPLGVMCGVSGVSGSGKSTLVIQELVPILMRELDGRSLVKRAAAVGKEIKLAKEKDVIGAEYIESLVVINQSPIGRTPRSNPATYLGIFDDIRKLYAQLPESQARGYKLGRFSFNTSEGRCFECAGEGTITYSMHFLPEVVMQCKTCKGRRYNEATLEILFKGKHIAEVLAMTAFEASLFFESHKGIKKKLDLLCEVGLEYLQLGQSSNTLSGGEAQRIKLVDELGKRGKNTLYILDEPTTGLHSCDIDKLLKVLNTLVDKGNSMIIIEHNIDVLRVMDYLIDMGPEGGVGGGTVVCQGIPSYLVTIDQGYTGRYLKPYFEVLQNS